MNDDDTLDRKKLNEDGSFMISSPDGSIRADASCTDRDRLRSMTEDEILKNALSDPDSPPLTTEELERLAQPNRFREVRQHLNLSVFQFAEQFGIPITTVLAWETGQVLPDAGSLVLLRVIEHDPDAVIRVIQSRAAD